MTVSIDNSLGWKYSHSLCDQKVNWRIANGASKGFLEGFQLVRSGNWAWKIADNKRNCSAFVLRSTPLTPLQGLHAFTAHVPPNSDHGKLLFRLPLYLYSTKQNRRPTDLPLSRMSQLICIYTERTDSKRVSERIPEECPVSTWWVRSEKAHTGIGSTSKQFYLVNYVSNDNRGGTTSAKL